MDEIRRQERAPQTTAAIKELILARGLHPGDPMPTEADLVAALGVSRSNVREAVRTLVALDILEVRHGTGTFVGRLSLRPLVEGMVFRGALVPGDDNAMLREVVEVRTALDLSLAPRIVAGMAGRPAPPELRSCVDEMSTRAARDQASPNQDRAFHLHLAGCVGNALYGELVAAFWDIQMTVAPRIGVARTRDLTDTASAHALLLQTALAGDLDGYREAVVAHYDPILRVLAASDSARVS